MRRKGVVLSQHRASRLASDDAVWRALLPPTKHAGAGRLFGIIARTSRAVTRGRQGSSSSAAYTKTPFPRTSGTRTAKSMSIARRVRGDHEQGMGKRVNEVMATLEHALDVVADNRDMMKADNAARVPEKIRYAEGRPSRTAGDYSADCACSRWWTAGMRKDLRLDVSGLAVPRTRATRKGSRLRRRRRFGASQCTVAYRGRRPHMIRCRPYVSGRCATRTITPVEVEFRISRDRPGQPRHNLVVLPRPSSLRDGHWARAS